MLPMTSQYAETHAPSIRMVVAARDGYSWVLKELLIEILRFYNRAAIPDFKGYNSLFVSYDIQYSTRRRRWRRRRRRRSRRNCDLMSTDMTDIRTLSKTCLYDFFSPPSHLFLSSQLRCMNLKIKIYRIILVLL